MKTLEQKLRSGGILLLSSSLWFLAAGCSGGAAGDRSNRGDFKVNLITTGQGQIYPYRIRELAGNQPTTNIVNIESVETLKQHVAANNAVLPVANLPTTAILPDGSPGNQYLLFRFSHKLQVQSVLSDLLANSVTNSGLTTAVSLLAYDPNTESTTTLKGRGFVNGFTYVNRTGSLELVQAVAADDAGVVSILEPEAFGFPIGFTGDEDLVANNAFVFVADNDDNLSSLDTFDPGVLIRVIVTNAVRDTDNKVLEQEVCTATTVGSDPNPPNVLGFTAPARPLQITPGNGQTGVDPTGAITVRFNKPVQPLEVGTFFASNNLTPASGGVALDVTAAAQTFGVIYYADPFDYSDFCNFRVQPAYVLPGNAPVRVSVNATSITGLSGQQLGNNVATTFTTGEGPGVVNAPVAPDAVYVGIGGAEPGVAVIDLNGVGQGTCASVPPAETNYRLNNRNIGQPGVLPALSEGSSSLDAGSKGTLTLVEDSRGNTRLLRAPLVGQVGDIHIGPPLDIVFNNSNVNVNASSTNQVNPLTLFVQPGNSIAITPHPNPPKLVYPPPNVAQAIFAEEPSVTSSQGPLNTVVTTVPPCIVSPVNQVVSASVSGFYRHTFEGSFTGPQPAPGSPPPPPPFCPFTARQQIGHFLYVLDQENRQVLVLNSNRFTVLDTIRFSDPFSMTFSPSLALCAVTNFASATVAFIDTDPRSATFNTVIAETRVAPGPTAVAWQPDGEAILVISTPSNTLNVLNAGDFSVAKQVSGSLNRPIELVVTERYRVHGNASNVYYAYILNENGSIAVYESGPSGVNGIGFDDVVGTVETIFRRARSIKYDATAQFGGVWVAHVDDGGLGQVSRLELTSTPIGQLPTNQISSNGLVLPPTFRQKLWTVTQRFGGSDPSLPRSALLSGDSPIDVATDEMLNNGYLPNQVSQFFPTGGQSILGHSSKGVALAQAGAIVAPYTSKFLFVALSDVGKIDVFDLETRAKVTTIDVPGVTVLATYWRQ